MVERCQGTGCTNFTQIATPAGTSYKDTSVSPSTSYSYRVRATDAAGNLSTYSNTATALTPDTTPPSQPGTLTATAVSGGEIDLSWGASTDNVGVTGYQVERCQGASCTSFAQIATPTATTYKDTTVAVGTSYSYRVRATDAAGNLSTYSNTASATTQTPDTSPPTQPGTLTATPVSGGEIDLSWGASTDNVGVTGYQVERCQGTNCTSFAQIASPTGTTYKDTSVSASTNYGYRVRATDAAGNLGPYSNTAPATTLAAPSGLVAAYGFDEGSGSTVTDALGQRQQRHDHERDLVDGWQVRQGVAVQRHQRDGHDPRLRLAAPDQRDDAGGVGQPVDGQRQLARRDLQGQRQLLLSRQPRQTPRVRTLGLIAGGTYADAFGTSALPANTWSFLTETYDGSTLRLYVNGTQVASTAHTGEIATSTNPLQIGGDSIYGQFFAGLIDDVRVYNRRSYRRPDPNRPDHLDQPIGPAGHDAAVAAGDADRDRQLEWRGRPLVGRLHRQRRRHRLPASSAARARRCSNFTQIATLGSASTTYKDTSVSANTSYSYRVRATDAAGNLSPYSNTATASTPSSLVIQYTGTDANGVASYNFTSSDDGYGTHVLRVLAPTNPAPGVPHNFLYVLPVEPELGTTYGDGLETLRSLDAQDQYNLTIIEPSFAIDPWYADNPTDPNLHYESFVTNDLVPWVTQNLTPPAASQPLAPPTGPGQNWLIGFSKSGIGGEDLLLKHPDVFALAASWDFPADMATYDQFGSSSASQYGTDANFQANYRLTSTFVDAHKAPFLTKNRIWIGGYQVFQTDVSRLRLAPDLRGHPAYHRDATVDGSPVG